MDGRPGTRLTTPPAQPILTAVTHVRQLAFPFPQHTRYAAADFLTGASNAETMAWLAHPHTWPGLRLAVHGEGGSGKTHLLHAFAERHGAILMPGEALRHLVDLPPAGGIALDDADAAPEPEALLHLLNAAAERQLPVLLAGRTPPSRWPVTLPDLASRLRAITAVAIAQPDDPLLRAMLARLLAERQLRVDAQLQDYLLARLPRHGAALRDAAACLDRLSLAAGRAVTRATATEVLARLADDDDPPPAGAPPSQQSPNLL